LVARELELKGLVTVTLNMFHELGDYVLPPRMVKTDNDYGAPFGQPGDFEDQKRTLLTCLNLIKRETP